MNKYDELTYYLLNRILILFGVRIVNRERLVFLYRTRNYAVPEDPESVHIVRLGNDITQAFGFLNMDYEDYKKQHFKTIFELTEWFIANCPFLTVEIVRNIEKEVEATPKDQRPSLLNMAGRFVETIKIGHVILRDFQYVPIIMYLNLKESIVRNYFDSEEVQEQFIDFKLRYLKETELVGKFSPKNVVEWIRPLRSKPSLTGIFTTSFVNYVTANEPRIFPRFLIDVDSAILRKEVISYYYNLFLKTKAYLEHVEKEGDNEVEGAPKAP